MDILLRTLFPDSPPPVIAAVGSGGKTSCLTLLARQLRAEGYRVLLTTSTHMRRNPEAQVGRPLPELLRRLERDGFLFAGSDAGPEKLGALPREQFSLLSGRAQVTLIEADGSRGLPLKAPAAWEPVLPGGTAFVLVLQGLSGLGHPLSLVCHRPELACALLNGSPGQIVTPERAARLLRRGYLEALDAAQLPFAVVLNQADAAEREQIRALLTCLEGVPVTVRSLRQELGPCKTVVGV